MIERLVARLAILTMAVVVGIALATGASPTSATELKADALLSIDRNRATVIERIVGEWGAPLEQSNAGIDAAQLRGMLESLRADHLLAASLAGSLAGLRDVLALVVSSDATHRTAKQIQALGDASQDLVYTPVAPCRLFDTRTSQGGLGTPAPNVRRTYGATAPVANQGGPGGCAATPGAAVALIQIGTLTPSGPGILQGGSQGAASFPNALILYQPGDQYGTAVAMPLNPANGQFDLVEQFATADLYGDLVGFLRPATGFVGSIVAGTGITVTGTTTPAVAVAGPYQLPQTCSDGQLATSTGAGAAWTCTSPTAASGGTVTSVATGAGLTGGPITASGTINLASTQLLPTLACTPNQIPKWSGMAWQCVADANAGGTVTSITAGAGLTGGTITGAGTIAVDPASTTLTGSYFKQGGNAFGATAVLGTTDNYPLEIALSGFRIARYEPSTQYPIPQSYLSPNFIGGHSSNFVTAGVLGASIGGGGSVMSLISEGISDVCLLGGIGIVPCANSVTDIYGTVSGGIGNQAGDGAGTVFDNGYASVGGGYNNWAAGRSSTIAGGQWSTIAPTGVFATIAGGVDNLAQASAATVAGGARNVASGNNAFIAGGTDNTAAGQWSFAAGYRAKSLNDGCITFADSSNFDFICNASNAFTTRATGGVWFVTGIDAAGNATRVTTIDTGGNLTINPPGAIYFGSTTRQMVNLYSSTYGLGVQAFTHYARSQRNFAWYASGIHDDSEFNPGTGGVALMTLTPAANPTALTVSGVARAQTFTSTSDRAAKTAFAAVDAKDMLDRVVGLPIATWSYRNEGAVRHIGPVAQDFRAAFDVGYDDKSIAGIDADGVALAAIQGLHQIVQEKDAKIDAQAAEIESLRVQMEQQSRTSANQQRDLAELHHAIDALLARTSADGNP